MAFSITYQPLCAVAFWHHHWLDGHADAFAYPPAAAQATAVRNRLLAYDVRQWLAVRPTDDTRQLLQQHGLTFKATTTGAVVVSRTGYTTPYPDFRISLEVHLLDPQLLGYTQLGVPAIQGRLFHLRNAAPPATPRLLLTAGGTGAVRQQHYLPRLNRLVRLPKLVPGQACQIEVFDEMSTLPSPVLAFDIPAADPLPDCELDCRSLRPGKYRIEGTNIMPGTWYLGLEDQPALLGIIDLNLTDWEGSTFDVVFDKI